MVKYDMKWKLYRGSKGLNWGDDKKIKEVVIIAKNNEVKAENL